MTTNPPAPGDPGFEMPNQPGTPADASMDAFEPPDSGELFDEQSAEEREILASAQGSDLQALKHEIECRLCSTASMADADAAVQSTELGNIMGVGYTVIDAEDLAEGHATGQPGDIGLVVYTQERVSDEALASEVAQIAGVRALSSLPIKQSATGVIDAESHRMRLRPAPGGVSTGHPSITAGTLGFLSRGRSGVRVNRAMMVSNWHVFDGGTARIGDPIIQPGRADGGSHPRDQIGILERSIPIRFGGQVNYVDCATAWCWPDRVRRELMFLAGTTPQFFRLGTGMQEAHLGMSVGKTGRTTQLRRGHVIAVGVTINVNFSGRTAQFRDQIAIRGANNQLFSQPGDSGSAVWTWDSNRRPVGLLFAGGNGFTFANRISRVLAALDVQPVV